MRGKFRLFPELRNLGKTHTNRPDGTQDLIDRRTRMPILGKFRPIGNDNRATCVTHTDDIRMLAIFARPNNGGPT